MKYFMVSCTLMLLFSCATKPKGSYQAYPIQETPDYSLEENWAALPSREDNGNKAPGSLKSNQTDALADVFYLYPTSYFGDRDYRRWNAEIDNVEINEWNDKNSVLYQATAWNSAAKVYAPRYRQAHIHAYYSKDKVSAKNALDLAYEDVKNAFSYYMSHYNNGRPFMIASHSQGTTHAARLIEEFIDDKPLQKKMIAAYLIGIPVDLDKYKSLKACESKDDTNCLIGWRTFRTGHEPKSLKKEEGYNVLITNPLSWKRSDEYISELDHEGAVFFDFEAEPNKATQNAQIHKSILWTNKPKFKGSWLYLTPRYHRGDINLFYMNIRENAENRVGVYFNNM